MEVLEFQYRKLFKLSAQEMEEEPSDKFFTNLYIYAQINKKEQMEVKQASKHGNR